MSQQLSYKSEVKAFPNGKNDCKTVMDQHYNAPWSTTLKIMTGLVVLLLIGIALSTDIIGTVLTLCLILTCAFFVVRGYTITDDKLIIQRLGWSKKFYLSQITDIQYKPEATSMSIRTFGIGGVFGFIGYFHNSILGTYRAYATNKKDTVVIDFDGNKVVVSPENPKDFIQTIHNRQK